LFIFAQWKNFKTGIVFRPPVHRGGIILQMDVISSPFAL
jgi:hypothetical protein